MPYRLSFGLQPSRLHGYERTGATATPFGVVELGNRGEHDVTVLGDGVPTVHVDDVLLPSGGTRILVRPGRITVDGELGTISQRRGLRLTRAAKAVTAQVAGRTYDVRMTGLNLIAVTRTGHGRVAGQRSFSRMRLEKRADAVDLAVSLALTDAIEPDALSVVPGG